jgi:hypothetical protein
MAQLPGKDRPAVPLSQLTACGFYMHSKQSTQANTMHHKESEKIIPRWPRFDIDDFR